VKRSPAEHVVQFLSFSGNGVDSIKALSYLNTKKWGHILQWMDNAGLAFYFLEKVKNTNAAELIPEWVLSRLQRSYEANRERLDYMACRFDLINRKFNDAGIRYVVVKGFSLVPQYCPDASLRHQGDFDYLIDGPLLPAAQQLLIELGYHAKPPSSDQEFIFVTPNKAIPTRSHEQYFIQAPHAVELHLDIWDSGQHRLPPMQPQFSVDRAMPHHWGALTFPALTEEDAFLLQVLHACQHLLTYWIRMSSLYEIGSFLNQRAQDASLWNRLEQRIGDNLMLRDFFVLISELVSDLFDVPIPSLARIWERQLRPTTRIWIEDYARTCAFCEAPAYKFHSLPPAKLVLFLLNQYKNANTQRHVVRNRLIAPKRFSRMASSIKEKPALIWNVDWWKCQRLVQRSVFHALSGLRYLCEVPRWWWRTRSSA
jgi:hypothetical protein